jgi:hypothetical protein
MSKVDAQRALREARYARFAAARAAESATVLEPATVVLEPATVVVESATVVVEPATVVAEPATVVVESTTAFAAPPVAEHVVAEAVGELCGHRSINGRSCTRPSGHPQKNHRYS